MPIGYTPPSGMGNEARRREKAASAKLRGRQSFDDQSAVDKIYQWIKENYEVPQRDVIAEMYRQERLDKYKKEEQKKKGK